MNKVCTHHATAQHSICQVQTGLDAAVACAQWRGCVMRTPNAVCGVAGAGPGCLEACTGSWQEGRCGPAGSSKHLQRDSSFTKEMHASHSFLNTIQSTSMLTIITSDFDRKELGPEYQSVHQMMSMIKAVVHHTGEAVSSNAIGQ